MYLSFIAFSMGVLLMHFSAWPIHTSAFFISFCIFAVLLIVYALWRRPYSVSAGRQKFRVTPYFLCFAGMLFVLGAVYAGSQIAAHKNAQVPAIQKGASRDLVINGHICSLPKIREYSEKVLLCSDRGQYLLSTPLGTLSTAGSNVIRLRHMCLRATVRLLAPRSTYNPDSNNYERHLFFQRVIGVARAKTVDVVPCKTRETLWSFVTEFRWSLYGHLNNVLDEHSNKGLFIALLLGHPADISVPSARILRDSGTQHLMAISGLHVGLICWGLYALLCKLRMQRFAIPSLAVCGLLYIALVGFGPSAQRAYIMMLCALFVVMGRKAGSFRFALLTALTLVLLVDPLSPLSQGFWFSFLAVASLLFVYRFVPYLKEQSVLVQLVVVQCFLTLLLTLVQAHFGLPLSLFSLFANLLAIPWVSFVILPMSLVGMLLSAIDVALASMLFSVLDSILNGLIAFLALAENFLLQTPLYKGLSAALFLLIAVLAVLFSTHKMLSASMLAFLFIALVQPLRQPSAIEGTEPQAASSLSVLDVGQGLSVAIHASAKSDVSAAAQTPIYMTRWLYDTGPSFNRYSSARAVVAPHLYAAGGAKLDGLIVSHGDADHAGDAPWLVERFQPKLVLLGEPDRWDGRRPFAARTCVKGQALTLGNNARLQVLWPAKESKVATDSNSKSCVVRIDLDGVTFLFMGDLEGAAERAFIKYYLGSGDPDLLVADVLLAGHHGARAATSMALLKHVRPRYVVFSAGYGNRFMHPAPEVLKRVKRFGADSLNTALLGAIIFTIQPGEEMSVTATRQQASDYWIAP